MQAPEDVAALAARYGLGRSVALALHRLAEALALEPDPHTAIRSRADVLGRHVADSLEALALGPVAEASRIADIGAGAGFPGLVLAVALPAARVDLVESQARKCAVIDRLAAAAEAKNARAVNARAEDWAAGEGGGRYDLVTARALAELPVLVEYASPLLRAGGRLVAWKGARDRTEEARGAAAAELAGLEMQEVRRVVPFEGARHRHLHVYAKVKEPARPLPRRSGQAVKRPLA